LEELACGKSNLLEHIILDDIHRGEGVAVIDPHRYLVDRLLDRIPASALDRVIFIEFGDPNWVPIFNPFHVADRRTQAHVAEEMVGAFKGIVDGWGDRPRTSTSLHHTGPVASPWRQSA
jgi:hypothetical protein